MRRRTALLGAVLASVVAWKAPVWWRRLQCYRRAHNPVRRFLGLFECLNCHKKGADLSDFRTMDDGYVSARWRA